MHHFSRQTSDPWQLHSFSRCKKIGFFASTQFDMHLRPMASSKPLKWPISSRGKASFWFLKDLGGKERKRNAYFFRVSAIQTADIPALASDTQLKIHCNHMVPPRRICTRTRTCAVIPDKSHYHGLLEVQITRYSLAAWRRGLTRVGNCEARLTFWPLIRRRMHKHYSGPISSCISCQTRGWGGGLWNRKFTMRSAKACMKPE